MHLEAILIGLCAISCIGLFVWMVMLILRMFSEVFKDHYDPVITASITFGILATIGAFSIAAYSLGRLLAS